MADLKANMLLTMALDRDHARGAAGDEGRLAVAAARADLLQAC